MPAASPYQIALYLLPLLGPRVSLDLENKFLSLLGIFSRPLEEKLQSRTKASPLCSFPASIASAGSKDLWGEHSPGPHHRTYQVQLITLDPLGPATPLFFALLHTLELVPVPAHCGLPSKKPTVVSSREEHTPPPWTGREGCFLTSIIQDALLAILV